MNDILSGNDNLKILNIDHSTQITIYSRQKDTLNQF